MTFIERLRFLFLDNSAPPVSGVQPGIPTPTPAYKLFPQQPQSEPALTVTSKPEPLPDWLTDDESLRDEGVLFGLSDAPPDGKIAQIRAAFAQQSASLEKLVGQYSEKIGELNLFVEQRENHITFLRNQAVELWNRQPTPNNLIRTVVSLCLSMVMCIGNFVLIDVTLQSSFSNRWIAVGVFLAGMFNLFGRLSFFYETDTRVSGRRLIEEVGMPLAVSIFILVQSLQTQRIELAIGLFVYVFFIFLLTGKLLLSTLTALQNNLEIIQENRRLEMSKTQNLPIWENDINRLEQEVDAIRAQKWPVVTALNHAEAELNQLTARCDRLINLFLSEFELARSLRQRQKLIMNYE